jgi:hypothetical protein
MLSSMGFLSVFRKVIGISEAVITTAGPIAQPFVTAANPLAGVILGTVVKSMVAAENGAANQTAGADKKSAAMTQLENSLLQEVNFALALEGKKITVSPALLDAVMAHAGIALDGSVTQANEVAAIVKLVEQALSAQTA